MDTVEPLGDANPQSAIRNPQSGTVPGIRLKPELHLRNVLFCVLVEKLREARGFADEDHHDARRERIEGPRMSDALCTEHPPDACDDVVRGNTGRLVDDQNSVHPSILLRFDS